MIKKISSTTLLLILICLFLLLVTVSLGIVLTRQSDAALRTMIENRMLDVSNTAAAMLDGDALEVLEAGDVDTPEYRSVLWTLSKYQENIDLEYIYCIRDMGDGNFVFTIDPSDDPGEFGEPVATTDALLKASRGTPAVDKEPYEDRWGRFYSAYTPVFNSEHKITGIVAVDFSAEWYEQQIEDQFRATFVISGISLSLAAVMIVLITTRFKKRFREMLDEMNAVSGDIETLVREISPGAKAEPEAAAVETHSADGFTELGNRIRSLEDQLSKKIALVRSRAYVDGLTGLGNRNAYEEHVKQIEDGIREGTAIFSIALFDMNWLKEINDMQGHEKGDEAILKVTSALKQAFSDAKIYRIGGDEFIAILGKAHPDFESRLRLVDNLLSGKDEVSVAKGYAEFEPGSDLGYRAVFNRADNSMYNDKKEYYLTHTDRRRRE